jgi:hypothetical protein
MITISVKILGFVVYNELNFNIGVCTRLFQSQPSVQTLILFINRG